MPSSIFSHQTPGLLLKIKFPKKFDGTALCIGAAVPDLNGMLDIFPGFHFRNITHSLLGQIYWTVPITILLTLLFSRYIGALLADFSQKENVFAKLLKYFGFDEFDNLKKKSFNKRFFIIASYSALIGGISHILLDLPSHEYIEMFYPWLLLNTSEVLLIPLIIFDVIEIGGRSFTFSIFTIIWTIEDGTFLIISLFLLRYIKKNSLLRKWYDTEKIN